MMEIFDKNNALLEIGDMVKFKEDRYTEALGIIETFTQSQSVCVKICGGGGMGNRLLLSVNCEKVIES